MYAAIFQIYDLLADKIDQRFVMGGEEHGYPAHIYFDEIF